MIVKTLEIRDLGIFIPALAVKLGPRDERDRYLLARSGYGRTVDQQSKYVVLWRLTGGEATADPYEHGGRTMPAAHEYIRQHFDELPNGAVVDVRVILGEESEPVESEAVTG